MLLLVKVKNFLEEGLVILVDRAFCGRRGLRRHLGLYGKRGEVLLEVAAHFLPRLILEEGPRR